MSAYTQEQLRLWAAVYEAGEVQPGVRKPNKAEIYRAHADALERIAKLEECVRESRAAMDAMLTHMGMDEDEWNRVTFDQMRAARDKARELVGEK